jgi:glycosyltransferase involved in cell wall biosynthesis
MGELRILHVAEAFGGGLMSMLVPLVEASAEMGHSVALIHGQRPETPIPVRDCIDESVELMELPGGRHSLRGQFAAARYVRGAVDTWRPDVVHLHSSFSGVLGGYAVGGRAATIFTPNCFASAFDHPAPIRTAYVMGERYACRRATVVGAVSWSEAELARRRGARRVVRVPNGVVELDAQPVLHVNGSNGVPHVVAVGRTVAQHQPQAAARILAEIADVAGVQWLGGGGGTRGAQRAQEIRDAGVPVSGWMPRDDLLRSLAGSTACLHWSAWDGLSLAVLEAVALGVVVVASDISPNREILGSWGVCGTEVEAAALLRRVVREPELAATLRREQREHAATFTARRMVAGWLELYEELATVRFDDR